MAPAPARPGAGQTVQPTSRALLWWCLGPWVQGTSPLASLVLPPGPGAVGQGTALPRCCFWGSGHCASGLDMPALIINHPYRTVGSRSWTGTVCPLLSLSVWGTGGVSQAGACCAPCQRGQGWRCRMRAPPVPADTREAPRAGTAKRELLPPSHGCSQPALQLVLPQLALPRPGPEPGSATEPRPQPGSGKPSLAPGHLSLPVAGDTSIPLAEEWGPAISFSLKLLPLAETVETTGHSKKSISIFLISPFIYWKASIGSS